MTTARCQAVSGTITRSVRAAIESAPRAHAGLQTPHPRQIPGSSVAFFPFPSPSIRMALTGHFFAHSPHPLHLDASKDASKGEVTTASNILNRLTAESMAQQQPQQWQTYAGRR